MLIPRQARHRTSHPSFTNESVPVISRGCQISYSLSLEPWVVQEQSPAFKPYDIAESALTARWHWQLFFPSTVLSTRTIKVSLGHLGQSIVVELFFGQAPNEASQHPGIRILLQAPTALLQTITRLACDAELILRNSRSKREGWSLRSVGLAYLGRHPKRLALSSLHLKPAGALAMRDDSLSLARVLHVTYLDK
jgi:hypothetical protein